VWRTLLTNLVVDYGYSANHPGWGDFYVGSIQFHLA
jgi:hypothetical protein